MQFTSKLTQAEYLEGYRWALRHSKSSKLRHILLGVVGVIGCATIAQSITERQLPTLIFDIILFSVLFLIVKFNGIWKARRGFKHNPAISAAIRD
ncbi:hypothetical protein [Lapidilactobacillus bayanensis]|uniref:hypothetical protein n=1 Tax=Lapidilactobacillus bayanensis TaxID=2485998 RepID=UPI000F769AF5|nr:hypothetical protein [Lapidilactobacillus bayanensis]